MVTTTKFVFHLKHYSMDTSPVAQHNHIQGISAVQVILRRQYICLHHHRNNNRTRDSWHSSYRRCIGRMDRHWNLSICMEGYGEWGSIHNGQQSLCCAPMWTSKMVTWFHTWGHLNITLGGQGILFTDLFEWMDCVVKGRYGHCTQVSAPWKTEKIAIIYLQKKGSDQYVNVTTSLQLFLSPLFCRCCL